MFPRSSQASDRLLVEPRAVARGNNAAVLAAARDADDGSVMIHNHPSGDVEPSDADLNVAGRLYEEGIGTAITNNDADRLFVVVEPPKPRVVQPLEIDRLEALIGPVGPTRAGSIPLTRTVRGNEPCSVGSPRRTTEAASHW